MSLESVENPQINQEQQSATEEVLTHTPEDINEMYAAARDQQQQKDAAEAQRMAAVLKDKMDVGMRAMPEEEAGATFTPTAPDATKKSSNSLIKKAALWGAMVGGLFMSQQAKGQEKTLASADKKPHAKEISITPKQTLQQAVESLQNLKQQAETFDELSSQEKTDWGTYVAYVNDHHLHDDPRMKTRAFANKVIEDFVHQYNASHATPTTMSIDLVPRVQREMALIRAMSLAEMAVTKANGGKAYNGHSSYAPGVEVGTESEKEFMPNLSDFDGIAGPQTLRPFAIWHEEVTRMQNANLNALNASSKTGIKGIDATVTYAKEKNVSPSEFISIKGNQDK